MLEINTLPQLTQALGEFPFVGFGVPLYRGIAPPLNAPALRDHTSDLKGEGARLTYESLRLVQN